MISMFKHSGRLAAILLLAATWAACDSSPAAIDSEADGDGAAQLSMVLADELSLSAVQQASVAEVASTHGGADAGEPGWLWYLAEELSQTLSDDQIQDLLDRAEFMAQRMRQAGMAGPFGPHPEGFGFNGRRPGLGEIGAMPGFGDGPRGEPLGDILTDEQKEALHEVRRDWTEQIREAAQAVRTADDRESAVAALRELLDAMRDAVDAWLQDNLTEDQLGELAAFRAEREAEREARREAVRAAIDDVLGDGVADQLEAIHDAFVAAVEAARETATNADELHAAIQEAAAARDEEVAALLDDDAYLILQIHQALQVRAANMSGHGPGGHRGDAPGNAPGNGPGHGPGNGPGSGPGNGPVGGQHHGPGGPGGQTGAGGPGGNGSAIHQAS